jgi:hypothetical protein
MLNSKVLPAAGDPDYTGFELRQVVIGVIIISAFMVDEIELSL